jgi:hypothetical protein
VVKKPVIKPAGGPKPVVSRLGCDQEAVVKKPVVKIKENSVW